MKRSIAPGFNLDSALTVFILSSTGGFEADQTFRRDFFDLFLALRFVSALSERDVSLVTGLCYSSHSLHILQIWSTVASGSILNTAAGEPSFRADNEHNSSGDIFLSKISATLEGGKKCSFSEVTSPRVCWLGEVNLLLDKPLRLRLCRQEIVGLFD